MTNRKLITSIVSAAGLLVLILDSRTGLTAAQDGVILSITTLIPSLFPFFIFSMLLTNALAGHSIRLLRPIGKLCRIPKGSESLLAIGLIGGYPVGAQNVISSYRQGTISQDDARRMIVFCNNAGPAFLFGYLGSLFENPIYPWLIWGIHIISALFLGWLLPGGSEETFEAFAPMPLTLSKALDQSIRVMGQVCGWVIIFRVLIGFLERWIFWAIPDTPRIILTGLLELSNGCILLSNLSSDHFRMILASAFLGFGGICVLLQTYSIIEVFGLSMYLPSKIFQGCISFLLAYLVHFLIPNSDPFMISPFLLVVIVLFSVFLIFLLRKKEKPVAISENLLYNQASCEKRRTICSSGKKSKNPVPTVLSVQN